MACRAKFSVMDFVRDAIFSEQITITVLVDNYPATKTRSKLGLPCSTRYGDFLGILFAFFGFEIVKNFLSAHFFSADIG